MTRPKHGQQNRPKTHSAAKAPVAQEPVTGTEAISQADTVVTTDAVVLVDAAVTDSVTAVNTKLVEEVEPAVIDKPLRGQTEGLVAIDEAGYLPEPTAPEVPAAVLARMSRLYTYLKVMDHLKPSPSHLELAQQQGALNQFLMFNLTQDMSIELNRQVLAEIAKEFRKHGLKTLSSPMMLRNWHNFMRTQPKLRDEAAAIQDTVLQLSLKGSKAPINWDGFRMLVRPMFADILSNNMRTYLK